MQLSPMPTVVSELRGSCEGCGCLSWEGLLVFQKRDKLLGIVAHLCVLRWTVDLR